MTTTNPDAVKSEAAESTFKSVEASLMEALSLDEAPAPSIPTKIEASNVEAKPSAIGTKELEASLLPEVSSNADAAITPESSVASDQTSDQTSESTSPKPQLENVDDISRENTADLSQLSLPNEAIVAKEKLTLDLPPLDSTTEVLASESAEKSNQALAEAALDRLALSDSERTAAKPDAKLQSLEQSMLSVGISRAEMDAILSDEAPQPINPAVPRVESNASSAPNAGEVKPHNKQTVTSSLLNTFKRSWKIQAASLSSLAIGFVASAVWNKPVEIVPFEPPVPPAVLYASLNSHRNEPIQPIVPFDGLNEDVIQLGAKLFHDSGLSSNGKMSCASCHEIPGSGADNNAFSMGIIEKAKRNTPSVFNSATNLAFNWDGEFETLEDQLASHVVQPWTLNSDWDRITKLLQASKFYDTSFKLYLRGEPNQPRAQEALAAYIRSLSTVGSNFDAWLQGEEQALSSDAIAGYHLFKKFNCVSCHQGANVGGTMYQSISKLESLWPQSVPSANKVVDSGREMFTQVVRDHNNFRVPSLRTASRTAPYMHDGSVATLQQAIEIMLEGYVGVKPNAVDVQRLAAFIEALDGEMRSVEFDQQQLARWKARKAAEEAERLELAQLAAFRESKAE